MPIGHSHSGLFSGRSILCCRDNIATAVTNTIRFDQRNQQDSGATSAPRMPVEPYTTAHHNSEHAPSVGRTRGLTRGVPVIHPPFAHASSGTVDGVGHLELVYACGKRAIRGSPAVSTGRPACRSDRGSSARTAGPPSCPRPPSPASSALR